MDVSLRWNAHRRAGRGTGDRASAGGSVTDSPLRNRTFGRPVTVRYALAAHLACVGDQVAAGQEVATVGSSGQAPRTRSLPGSSPAIRARWTRSGSWRSAATPLPVESLRPGTQLTRRVISRQTRPRLSRSAPKPSGSCRQRAAIARGLSRSAPSIPVDFKSCALPHYAATIFETDRGAIHPRGKVRRDAWLRKSLRT